MARSLRKSLKQGVINLQSLISMLKLSLEDINKCSAYKIYLSNDDTYVFTTDHGTIYEVGFVEDCMLGMDNVYQFFIAPKNSSEQPKDDKIQSTIVSIIEDFFKNNDVLLDYICDTSDGRQALRNRLFSHWFALYPRRKYFTLRSISVYYEDISFYASVLIKNDNPKYAECLLAVDNFEMQIRDKLK